MKRPDFQEKTEVKVIDHALGILYGQRGTVVHIVCCVDGNQYDAVIDKEKIKAAYLAGKIDEMTWAAEVKMPDGVSHLFRADQLDVVQHKFVDIDYIREEDIDLGTLKPDGTKAIRPKNTGAFEPGDFIQISTKIDGANASMSFDETTGKLEVFSRTNLLTEPGALRGFYDYIKTKVEPLVEKWDGYKDLVFFGEWCISHTVQYNKDWYNKWRIYDIYGKKTGTYLPQDFVKKMCNMLGLEYIEVLYEGPFISWDHCRSFIGKSTAYGPAQEGIVIKNQTKLNAEKPGGPVYIKIVDEKFKEHMENKGHKARQPEDPEVTAAKRKAEELMATVITEARVKKLICKFIDDGILPVELTPKDMGTCMKNLPKRLFEDLLKEEPAVVEAAGEYAGKICSAMASKFAKAIIVGK